MYSYSKYRPLLFTEEYLGVIIKVSKNIDILFKTSGAFKTYSAFNNTTPSIDSFMVQAVLDYLVETKYIREVTEPGVWGQDRVFVAGENHK